MSNNYKVIDNPTIGMVTGFHANGLFSGVKKSGKLDLGVVYCDVQAKTYAMYTSNKFRAAPLQICEEHIADNLSQLLVVNSGVANACTGDDGRFNAILVCNHASKKFRVLVKDVVSMSTGVIGEQLPVEKICKGIDDLESIYKDSNDNNFCRAIMTTDTRPKICGVEFEYGGKTCRLVGTAKGSGMIDPNMATMLAFMFTDANVDKDMLNKAFRESIQKSFNSITVDGDMSTNDTVMIMASGLAENSDVSDESSDDYANFKAAVNYVATSLAQEIVKDGEGATKLIEIEVQNAPSVEDAKMVGKAIANSALVKTAFFGEDANWGRIVCALGYSGAEFNPDAVTLKIGDVLLFEQGERTEYKEEDVNKFLKNDEIKVEINLNSGNIGWTVWTTDLSHDYIKINAGYRT